MVSLTMDWMLTLTPLVLETETGKNFIICSGKVPKNHIKSNLTVTVLNSKFEWRVKKFSYAKIVTIFLLFRTVKLTKSDILGEGTFGMSETAKKSDDEIVELKIREASKVLKMISSKPEGVIDLFHVNCEGCEWEMMENIISNGLHKKMKMIQFGSHYFSPISDISYRYCKIRDQLQETHSFKFGIPFAWERWEILDR